MGTKFEQNSYLNCGNVGIDDDSVDALLLERLDGLGAGVVKLPRLPDGQAPRTKDQHLRTKHICASAGEYKYFSTQRLLSVLHVSLFCNRVFARIFY